MQQNGHCPHICEYFGAIRLCVFQCYPTLVEEASKMAAPSLGSF